MMCEVSLISLRQAKTAHKAIGCNVVLLLFLK